MEIHRLGSRRGRQGRDFLGISVWRGILKQFLFLYESLLHEVRQDKLLSSAQTILPHLAFSALAGLHFCSGWASSPGPKSEPLIAPQPHHDVSSSRSFYRVFLLVCLLDELQLGSRNQVHKLAHTTPWKKLVIPFFRLALYLSHKYFIIAPVTCSVNEFKVKIWELVESRNFVLIWLCFLSLQHGLGDAEYNRGHVQGFQFRRQRKQ